MSYGVSGTRRGWTDGEGLTINPVVPSHDLHSAGLVGFLCEDGKIKHLNVFIFQPNSSTRKGITKCGLLKSQFLGF